MRRKRYRPPLTGRQRAAFWIGAVSFITAVILLLAVVHLHTLMSELAVTRAKNTVGRIVTAAVCDAIDSGDIQYDQLITLRTNADGEITALQSNMAEFNRLQGAITQDILQRLSEVSQATLSIPVGTLTGMALLSGRGPRFSVKVEMTGSCTAHFANSFDHAGINQTTHSIILYVDVSMSIFLPGERTSAKVSNAYSVAETVIVGDVPDSYTYFDSGEDIVDEAHEYAINNG